MSSFYARKDISCYEAIDKNIKELFQVEETAGSSYKHPDVSLGKIVQAQKQIQLLMQTIKQYHLET